MSEDLGGFAHHHDDDALRVYRRLSPEEKLRWLHAAWRFTVDFLPPAKRRVWQELRSGVPSPKSRGDASR